MFARFVARRYLFAPGSRSAVHLITWLSAVAVAVPVAAMIVLLSVFNGFERLVGRTGSLFEPDLTVEPRHGRTFDLQALDTALLARTRGVAELAFVLEQGALLEHGGRRFAASVRGVDDRYAAVLPPGGAVVAGDFRVRQGDLDALVVGRAAAMELGIRSLADARVTLYAPRRSGFTTLLPLASCIRRTVSAAGIYELDLETERRCVLTSLRLAQELFARPGQASALYVRLDPGADPARVRDALSEAAGGEFRVQTRAERNAPLHAVMRYEKWAIFFVALLVLVIASFSVVGALAMLIADKRGDIGTLRAMGASEALVRRVFRLEGWYVSGLGAAAGLLAGLALVWVQHRYAPVRLPADTFLTDRYPVALRAEDLAAVLLAVAAVTATVTRIATGRMLPRRRGTEAPKPIEHSHKRAS